MFARLLSKLLRWSLGLCALGLILAALFVSLGRQLMPLVAEYRDEVQAEAVSALKMPLHIGRLEGRWQGFAPVLVAHDVLVGEGRGAVQLDQVQVVPALLDSLLARQPRLASLQVDGLQLSLHEDAGGHWTVKGLPQRESSGTTDPQQLLDALPMLRTVSLLGSQLTFEPYAGEPFSLTYIDLTLRSGTLRQRLDGRLRLPDGQPLAFDLAVKLNPRDWLASRGSAYLSLPQSDWARWLPKRLTGDWQVHKAQAGGELWLDWDAGALQRGAIRLHAPELQGAYAQRAPVAIEDLGLSAYFERRSDGFELLVDSLAMTLGEKRWGDVKLQLSQQLDGQGQIERWGLAADQLDLTPLGPLIQALAPLPDMADEALAALHPRGTLRNVQVDYRPQLSDARRVQFSANLRRVSIGDWHDVPAVQNASGSVRGDLAGGEGRLASGHFGLHFTHLFPEMWRYRQAGGTLRWHLDDEAFTLYSPYLRLEGEEGQVAGDFLVRLMKDPAQEDYMDLRVGLKDGDALKAKKYLPTRSPGFDPGLAEWLQTAIQAGHIDNGWFQYQGSLAKDAAREAHSITLYFQVNGAQLAFQPGWPELHNVRGEVLVDDRGVEVRVPDAQILDSRLQAVQVRVPHVDKGQAPHLNVDGEVHSSLADALKILQEAPIGTAETFAGWRGQGPLQGRLQLDMPLAKGGQPKVVVDFATEGAQLQMATPKLDFSQLSGAFRFDSTRGLSAPDIRAQVLGHAVHGKALAGGSGKQLTRIEAGGRIALKQLSNWLAVTQPLPLSGEIPYQLSLTLDGEDSQLRVDSDLKGLAVNLPAPFGKSAEDARKTRWRMTLQGKERRYWLDYGRLASLSLAAAPEQLSQARGELRLGGDPARLPTNTGIQVSGRLDELDWSDWQAALDPYMGQASGQNSQLLRSANVVIGRFRGFGTVTDNLNVSLTRAQSAWQLDLASALLEGRVLLPDAKGAAINVDLARLNLPAMGTANEGQKVPVDPLAAVDPRQIPAFDLHVDKLLLADEALGSGSFKARPTATGTLFSDLDLQVRGLRLGGAMGWEASAGETASWYKGRIEGKDLAEVLRAWHYAPSVTSERFRLDVDGRWPGSPAGVDLAHFSGSLGASLRKGQFAEIQGSASALRVFGLLNFNSISRRLRLDFSDLLDKGFSYDTTKTLLVGQDGVFDTREPLRVVGPSSTLELNGRLDMPSNQIDARLLVTLPVTNNLPLAALIVGAPAIGGALFVADKLLGDKVARFASVQYKVKGPWQNPEISFDKPFEKPR